MTENRFQDFIQFAIDNEIEAAQLYETNAAKVKSASAKAMLEDMAAMERGHEKKLTDFKQTGTAFFSKIGVIENMHINDYMLAPELNEESSIQDVFVFAMKAEQKACELYTKLRSLETDAHTQKLFATLADEEKKHKHDLEAEYEKEFMQEG